VQLRTLGKACLILAPVALVGLRLYSRAASNPVDVSREVTRCLSLVRAAARRERDHPGGDRRERKPRQQDSPPAAVNEAASEMPRRTA
jgi:hypothetical protein